MYTWIGIFSHYRKTLVQTKLTISRAIFKMQSVRRNMNVLKSNRIDTAFHPPPKCFGAK